MKLFILFFFIPLNLFSQENKDEIYYTSKIIYLETEDSLLNTVSSIPFGKDVHIGVDTIFKKYTIMYTDEDNKKKVMILKFIRNYFDKNDMADSKIYLMQSQNHLFMLVDYMDHPLINSLALTDEKQLPNGRFMVLRIRNVKPK